MALICKTSYFISFLILLFLIPFAVSVTFNLTNIDPQSENKEILIEGDAAYISTHGMELTPEWFTFTYGKAGRATYIRPFHLWDKQSGKLASFSTNFTFVINSYKMRTYGNGLTFFLGENTSVTTHGETMGLPVGFPSLKPMSRFVAVEFDTFWDEWDPVRSDNTSVGDHVGISISSLVSVRYQKWLSDVPNGRVCHAWIVYDAVTKNLSVSFTGFRNHTTVRQDGLVYAVDLRNELPEWVVFGFTGGVGSVISGGVFKFPHESHTVKSWSFSSSDIPAEEKNSKVRFLVGILVGISFLATLVFLLWMCKRMKACKDKREEHRFSVKMRNDFEMGICPKRYSYHKLARSTCNFAESKKLGEGGFGKVYKGFFKDYNTYAAIKRVSRSSKQGIKEYSSEIMIISRLRHRNLVQLIGWCHENRELLLVYEYMENGSLDLHLFKEKSLLTWDTRYEIAQGLSSALLYLHDEWEQCVLHRDIKSSNIMLDSNFNPKLGDFGLAKLVEHEKGSKTTMLAGTMGYMAPEYLATGKVSKESDVYSFGVVALEIASGRRTLMYSAIERQIRLVEWVWELYGAETLVEAADPRLGTDFNKEELQRLLIVGLWCVHPDPEFRPSMRQVVQVLKCEASLPKLPAKMPMPTYSTHPTSSFHGLTSIVENQMLKLYNLRVVIAEQKKQISTDQQV